MLSRLHLSIDGFAHSGQFEEYVRQRLETLLADQPLPLECRIAIEARPEMPAADCRFVVRIEIGAGNEVLAVFHEHEYNVMSALNYALLAMYHRLGQTRSRLRRAAKHRRDAVPTATPAPA